MVAPLCDDKGNVRYFIGAQVDVSGLVDEGRGVESFRSMLRKGDGSQPTTSPAYIPKPQQQHAKNKDALIRLEELTTMFSEVEVDTANKSMRTSDTVSETSKSTMSNRLGAKRIIDMEETSDFSLRLAQLDLAGNSPATSYQSLPGVYRHVGDFQQRGTLGGWMLT